MPNPASDRREFIRSALGLGAGAVIVTIGLGGCGSNSEPVGEQQVSVSEVPLGGGLIVGGFVVTQPDPGNFSAFSARCPHAGVPVDEVSNGLIACFAHGAYFDAADGSVTSGPTEESLTPAELRREGDQLFVSLPA